MPLLRYSALCFLVLFILTSSTKSSPSVHSPAHDALIAKNPQSAPQQSALGIVHQKSNQKLVTRRAPLPRIEKPAPAADHVRLDPANLVVVVLAAALLIYSSRRSLKPPSWDIDGSASGSGEVSLRCCGNGLWCVRVTRCRLRSRAKLDYRPLECFSWFRRRRCSSSSTSSTP
jgi:hypothetical protein